METHTDIKQYQHEQIQKLSVQRLEDTRLPKTRDAMIQTDRFGIA